MPTTSRSGHRRARLASLAENVEPRILFHFDVQDPIADASVPLNAPATTIALGPRIFDETKGTTVRLNYGAQGNMDLLLLDYEAPLSVANFLGHVNNNTYDNSVIHRSEPGRAPNPVPFVIQGGGYRPNGSDISPPGRRPSPTSSAPAAPTSAAPSPTRSWGATPTARRRSGSST
jgi:hypothetical protein